MKNSFSFCFTINDRIFDAIAVADLAYNPIGYHVQTGDLRFSIFPKEGADGTLIWVDEDGDTMPLIQSAGDAITDYELRH